MHCLSNPIIALSPYTSRSCLPGFLKDHGSRHIYRWALRIFIYWRTSCPFSLSKRQHCLSTLMEPQFIFLISPQMLKLLKKISCNRYMTDSLFCLCFAVKLTFTSPTSLSRSSPSQTWEETAARSSLTASSRATDRSTPSARLSEAHHHQPSDGKYA